MRKETIDELNYKNINEQRRAHMQQLINNTVDEWSCGVYNIRPSQNHAE